MSPADATRPTDPSSAPKDDRLGNNDNRGANPGPGGEADTEGSAVPPYEGRTTSRDEPAEGTARAWGSEPPAKEPAHPGSGETPADAEPAPEGVGESTTRRGEDVVKQEGKEAGRQETGTHEAPSDRPTGTSEPRDATALKPPEDDGEAAPQAP